MKPITLFFAALLVVAGFGAGMLVGRHGVKSYSSSTKDLPDSSASAPGCDAKPD
jgi:F0F1-type ATP synthase membrane subunit c/vacuolar-type H+-ATPase subunit K